MAKYYGDIAKATKDVLTGSFNYDNKITVDTKKSDGFNATGSFVQKGDTPTGTLTTSYSPVKDVTVDLQVNQCGKITTTLAHSGLYPGLKTTLSGQPIDPPSLKLATQLYQSATGIKFDVTNYTAPKIDASVCYSVAGFSVGGTGTFDTVKNTQKFAAACQFKEDGVTYAICLADQFNTAKLSCVNTVDKTLSVAAEMVYKIPKSDFTASMGATKKFTGGQTAKLVVSTPVVADPTPTASMYVSGEVMSKTTGSVSLQVDKDLKYKYGVQLSMKM